MFGRSRFLSFPTVIGAVVYFFIEVTEVPKMDRELLSIGVVSGKAIFGPPLDKYWKKKLEEEASAKGADSSSS